MERTGHPLTQISTLNRVLGIILVIFMALWIYDAGVLKRRYDRGLAEKQSLDLRMDQSRVLENVYQGLEQKEKTLTQAYPMDPSTAEAGDSDHLLREMARANNLVLDRIDIIAGESGEGGILRSVSLRGDFAGLRDFLLDVLALPGLVRLPGIQVLAGRGELEIMMILGIFEDKSDAGREIRP